MIQDKDILFVTTTLYTKWLGYQQNLLKKYFPDSEQLVVNGTTRWPNVWFDWIPLLKNYTGKKWLIHLDEDCFIQGRDEIITLLEKMESEGWDCAGVPDGMHHYRGANPVAFNTFFMICDFEKTKNLPIDLNNLQFGFDGQSWRNNKGVGFQYSYMSDFKLPFDPPHQQHNFLNEQEPYYYFMWSMKLAGFKFLYLYPHFDETFKSTNPRIEKDSPDIAIHMWYTRGWNSNMDVHGLPNVERYNRVEKNILSQI